MIPLPTATLALLGFLAAHQGDTTDLRLHAAGAVTVTSNGISLIPALTLGKPAGILDVAIGRRGWSFAPQFRWALEGRPWAFIFWGRYRFPTGDKFHFVVGAHPAFSFKTVSGEIVARRYFATEVAPSYTLTRHLDLGAYYFYSKGIDDESIQNTHMIAARGWLTNIPIARDFAVHFAPQLYYLAMDGDDGTYFTSTLSLSHRKLPISLASLITEPIQSDIAGGQEFLWNVSVVYSIR